jgi:hypothetical protein
MKVNVFTGEAYPHVFIYFPGDIYYDSDIRIYNVPDDLAEQVHAARDAYWNAERALIQHLVDTGQAILDPGGISRIQP